MGAARRARGTSTSAFGAGRREGHDASAFYARFAPPVLSTDDDVGVPLAVDEVVCGDARSMQRVADATVALVVTSPPYFAGKEYEQALGEGHVPATYLDYLRTLEDVFAECVRVLEPGGRLAVNVANLGRRPYRSLAADVTAILQDRLRLLLRGEVIWRKAEGAGGNCAWGSFASPANPVLRDVTERVVIASKGRFDRTLDRRERARRGLPHEATVTADEFLDATLDVWELPPERATRVGHPAPFPVELPQRLIELYTYRGDLVLDPFLGSGSTAVAAVRTGRRYVGYETDPGYVAIAAERIEAERGARDGTPRDGTGRRPVHEPGAKAKDLARATLEAAGFHSLHEVEKAGNGLDTAFGATDARGRRWRIDVAGGLTTGPSGLRRADMVWRLLGKAAALHEADPKVPYLVLAVDGPAPGPAATALRACTGRGKPITDVVVLDDPAGLDRLRRHARGT